ncbi:MAG: beta-eliminating lyase-related protein [Lachnospiraceae bacterium]|nr:beta-eliminating lyase-related protein [Lachnospiraceae bacterium]
MRSFACDYIAGAHPEIIKRLTETNLEVLPGYTEDKYCMSATERIKKACQREDLEIFYLVGGTQTNQIVIDTMLANYEGVVAAKTGHVSIHEAGAIEFSGHKVIEIEGEKGKLSADKVDAYIKAFYNDENHEHMVFPGMVYISFPTEYGTLYSKNEMKEIHEVCKKYNIPLFVDGARLIYGLASYENDLSLKDLCDNCDVFYIGGTKAGTLCGEAVVFTNKNMPKHFLTQVKQHGALLAKGRLLGVQFDTMFTDDLYVNIGKWAIDKAEEVKEIFKRKGYKFLLDSPTNQQFIIMNNEKIKELEKEIGFSFWENYDENNTVVRFATSWSTTEDDIKELEKLI